MKRILSVLLAAMLVGTLMIGCTKKEESSSSSAPSSSSDVSSSMSSSATVSAKDQLEKVHKAVKDVYGENYIPSMPIEIKQLSEMYGITTDNIEEFIAEGPAISTHVDVFIGAKAKSGKVDEVEKEFIAYKDKLVKDSMQYPMNLAKVNAAQVVKEGDYVFFVMVGAINDKDGATEDEQAKFAQDEVKKAVDAIKAQF